MARVERPTCGEGARRDETLLEGVSAFRLRIRRAATTLADGSKQLGRRSADADRQSGHALADELAGGVRGGSGVCG